MIRQLQELTKEELIEIVQDYQEMVSDIEGILNAAPSDPWEGNENKMFRHAIRDALDKERPGWKIHKGERDD